MEERRQDNRRQKLVRNIFSYLNRRNLFKRGRRKDEEKYRLQPDPFEKKGNRPL